MISFQIGEKTLGGEAETFIVAEIGQAHEGSLGIAHSYIEAVADAGVDAIKFQTHIAEAESTLDDEFRIPFSYEDPTRYDYWKRMEFTFDQWLELAEHAKDRRLIFFSTPFSIEAAQLLDDINVPAWKIGSGDLLNYELLNFVTGTKKPILLSSGMNGWKEISQAVNFCKKKGCMSAVLQCTSSYPVDLAEVGINVISEIKNRFGVPAGLSDHSGTIFPSLAAMALGAAIVEIHVVFNRKMFGPDTIASITLDDLSFLVEARKAFLKMRTPVDKDRMAEKMSDIKRLFGRSLALKESIPQGTILSKNMITLKKPGIGIPPQAIEQVIGKRVKMAVPHNRLLSWEDLEDAIE